MMQTRVNIVFKEFKEKLGPRMDKNERNIKDTVRKSEMTAKYLESCGKDVHECVQLVTQTTEIVADLAFKLDAGLSSIDKGIAENLTTQKLGMDLAHVESRITDQVMMKFNDEYKRKMGQMVVLRERKEG